jgi:lauroyl/myristoyl acyltransferase
MKNEIKTVSIKVADQVILPRSKMKGLGDAVAYIAKPIAKVIDKMAGTNLKSCNACNKRQHRLNQIIPFDI